MRLERSQLESIERRSSLSPSLKIAKSKQPAEGKIGGHQKKASGGMLIRNEEDAKKFSSMLGSDHHEQSSNSRVLSSDDQIKPFTPQNHEDGSLPHYHEDDDIRLDDTSSVNDANNKNSSLQLDVEEKKLKGEPK
jgi:hypothetical protein